VVEMSYKDSKFEKDWNHKVYLSKEIAIDSINQRGNHGVYKFRVKPVYVFRNNTHRNYLIEKILEEK
jgi:hypothetical protein